MCARFSMFATPSETESLFGLVLPEEFGPRYNIAPTQTALAVVHDGCRQYRGLSWGIVPQWIKDRTVAERLINARAETAFVKPTFRASARHHRCLVPASGFFEWCAATAGGPKQPLHFQMSDSRPFAMGGLWQVWHDDQGSEFDEFAILTTFANDLVAQYHERMPVILRSDDFDAWLDPTRQRAEDVNALMVPFPASEMRCTAVSPRMNSPRVEDAANLTPISTGTLF